MADGKSKGTINTGGASDAHEAERDREFEDIAGNVRERGEDPSPDDRARGETSRAGPSEPADIEAAHDRAS